MAWRQHAAIQSRGQHFPVDKTIGTPPEKVCKFTFFNVLQSIRTREDDCSVLFGMLERTLYKDRSDG